MAVSWENYSFKKGDHWIEQSVGSLELHAQGGKASPEVHALLGIAKGIKLGSITQGNYSYAHLALKATVDGDAAIISNEIMDLARYGLFTPNCLGGHHGAVVLEGSGLTVPVPDFNIFENDPENWHRSLIEELFRIDEEDANATLTLLKGILAAVGNGIVKNGKPEYGRLLLEAAKSSPHPQMFSDLLQQFGEIGFFGEELLLGCEPVRASAVSRVK